MHMTWIEITESLMDPLDYVAFAVACKEQDVDQDFRPSDYIRLVTDLQTAAARGNCTLVEAYEIYKLQQTPQEAIGAECSTCDTPASLGEMLESFSKSMFAWVKAGMPLADRAIYEQRMVKCLACTDLNNSRCGLCGCFIHVKGRLATATCPKGEW